MIDPGNQIQSQVILKHCPKEAKDHSNRIIPIVYGEPTSTSLKKAEQGIIKLGGCIVDIHSPRWHCKKHDIDF